MTTEKRAFEPGRITLLTILLSSMIILMGGAAVAPALKPISEAFPDASAQMISMIIALPSLGVALTGFGMGYLSDRYGKVKVLFLSLVIFTVTGTSGYFATSLEMMLVGRFLLGVGITGISLTTTALIGEYWTGANRAKIIGYQSAAIGIGTLFLETAGGTLAEIGWQEPFLIYLIGVPIILLGLISVREPKSRDAVTEKSDVRIENIKQKIAFCYLIVFLEMFLMFSMPVNFSYYISEIGQSLTMCGVLLGLLGTSQAVFSILYSRTSNKLDDISAYAVSFLLMGIGLALLFIPSLPVTFLSMIVSGFSLGLLMPTVVGQLTLYSRAGNSGKIMGGYSVVLNLSTFISSIGVTALVSIIRYFGRVYLYLGIASGLIFAAMVVLKAVLKEKPRKVTDRVVIHEPAVSIEHKSDSSYGRILIPTDGSEHSRLAVNKAINIAIRRGRKLPPCSSSIPKDTRALLRERMPIRTISPKPFRKRLWNTQ